MDGVTLRQRSSVLLVTVLATACSAAVTLPSPQPRVPATIAPVGDMPVSPSPAPPAAAPAWQGSIHRIGPALRPKIVGRSWHPGCPVPLRDLRAVEVSYWNFEGTVRRGPLIVHERVASDVLWVFHRLFRARFPIKRIVLPPKWHPPRPSDYWDQKPTSPSAAFNCRPATDSTTLSQHAYGWAIDINPLQNPYVRSDGSTLRAIAQPYRDRSLHREGMIHDGDIVVRSFARIGWEWGGHWHTLKDYMHFSLTGR
jgi:hypothetical protein